jgi:FkbM family methyltransferase
LALPLKVLHQAAAFFEDAYANTGDFYAQHNGEQGIVRKLHAADFRTAFDAGANFGEWTIDAATEWPRCHVHAFEVAPPNYRKLEEKVLSSAFRDRITLNCFGLSDADLTRRMYFYPNHPELTCDNPRHGDSADVFDAPLRAGDNYASSLGIKTIDFLKIDVEGAEYPVLKGFERMLSSGRIHCIQFEYSCFAAEGRVLLRDFYSFLGNMY